METMSAHVNKDSRKRSTHSLKSILRRSRVSRTVNSSGDMSRIHCGAEVRPGLVSICSTVPRSAFEMSSMSVMVNESQPAKQIVSATRTCQTRGGRTRFLGIYSHAKRVSWVTCLPPRSIFPHGVRVDLDLEGARGKWGLRIVLRGFFSGPCQRTSPFHLYSRDSRTK